MGGYYLDSLKDLDPVVLPTAIGARAIRIDLGEPKEGEKRRREEGKKREFISSEKIRVKAKFAQNSHITNLTHPCAVLCAIL